MSASSSDDDPTTDPTGSPGVGAAGGGGGGGGGGDEGGDHKVVRSWRPSMVGTDHIAVYRREKAIQDEFQDDVALWQRKMRDLKSALEDERDNDGTAPISM